VWGKSRGIRGFESRPPPAPLTGWLFEW
jgi:hypothetical protein